MKRRHLKSFLGPPDGANQEALSHPAGNNSRAGVSSFQDAAAVVEAEATLQFPGIRRVTLIAMLREKGADIFFEELQVGGSECGQGFQEPESDQNLDK